MPLDGGFAMPWGILFDPDGKKTDEMLGKENDEMAENDEDTPGSDVPGGGGNPGGFYEESMFGTSTWHSTTGAPDLHGAAARRKADQVLGGLPTDGITGNSGTYGDWDGGDVPGSERPGA